MTLKPKVVAELKSVFITFLSVFAVEAFAQLTAIYNGDFSKAAWVALCMAALRALVKAIMQILFPKMFGNG